MSTNANALVRDPEELAEEARRRAAAVAAAGRYAGARTAAPPPVTRDNTVSAADMPTIPGRVTPPPTLPTTGSRRPAQPSEGSVAGSEVGTLPNISSGALNAPSLPPAAPLTRAPAAAAPLTAAPPKKEPTLADQIAERRAELKHKLHPDQAPTALGRFGHTMNVIGQDIGMALEPNIMERIPGTIASNRAELQRLTEMEGQERGREATAEDAKARLELERQKMDIERQKVGLPKLLSGEGNAATTADGRRLRAYEIQRPGELPQVVWYPEGGGPLPPTTETPAPTGGALPQVGGGGAPTAPSTLPQAGGGAAPTPPTRPGELPPGAVVGKFDETKQPIGDAGAARHAQELETLTGGMNPQEKQKFITAFGATAKDQNNVATKRLEDAKAAAQLSAGERDRALNRQIAITNHQDAERDRQEARALKTVEYKDKNGDLVSGSYEEAVAANGKGGREVSKEDVQKSRTAFTQYGRLIDNAQAVSDSMRAWDNPHDKQLAIRIKNDFFAHAIIPGVGVDAVYLNTMLNADDIRQLSPLAQTHMQNMLQLYSDAINMLKQETGGVPKGQDFLRTEGAILPQPEKSQLQNRQAIEQFSKRVLKDSTEYARPNTMARLHGIVPDDAKSRLKNKQGELVGYEGADGKDVYF